MKYLFIVQGEGRGHLTQAIALADILRRNGHEVCEVLLGKSKNRDIPEFFLKKIGCRVNCFDTLSFRLKKQKTHPPAENPPVQFATRAGQKIPHQYGKNTPENCPDKTGCGGQLL